MFEDGVGRNFHLAEYPRHFLPERMRIRCVLGNAADGVTKERENFLILVGHGLGWNGESISIKLQINNPLISEFKYTPEWLTNIPLQLRQSKVL